MTLLQIEILMHYHCSSRDYRNGDHSAPAVREAIDFFLDSDMLRHEGFRPEYNEDGSLLARYKLTSRGEAFVKFIQVIPLPTASWHFDRGALSAVISAQHQNGEV